MLDIDTPLTYQETILQRHFHQLQRGFDRVLTQHLGIPQNEWIEPVYQQLEKVWEAEVVFTR